MQKEAWAILWRSESRLDGARENLIGTRLLGTVAQDGDYRPAGAEQTTMTFRTKREASAFIKAQFGYLSKRPDLRAEPHGWKMPMPVRVRITVEQINSKPE